MAQGRKTFVLRRPDQVAALASPVRCQIVDCLTVHGPSSVREVAARMSRTPESLYYHVKALVAAGLVLLQSTRKVNRRREAVYKVVAPRLIADRKKRSLAYKEALARTGEVFLRLAAREHRAAVECGDVPVEGPRRVLSLRRHSARLTPASLERLNRHLDHIFDLLDKCDDPKADGTFAVTVALSPVSPRTDR